MPDDAEVTICQSINGFVIEYEGRFFSDTLSLDLEEAISKWDGKKRWLIKLSDMTVSMALWYARYHTAQEVLECRKPGSGSAAIANSTPLASPPAKTW